MQLHFLTTRGIHIISVHKDRHFLLYIKKLINNDSIIGNIRVRSLRTKQRECKQGFRGREKRAISEHNCVKT